jgi:hypothetical protein
VERAIYETTEADLPTIPAAGDRRVLDRTRTMMMFK